ncbi:hypothetical protein ACGGAQ_07690 [Micromonospora sp. NPDC047557]|uniref:hypothetical protein n=1 Tax=Micromonospora sp. NPDC047557 TaxID=3364250 RepID=UPI0037150D33
MTRKIVIRTAAAVAAAFATIAIASPAQAADTWTKTGPHAGDVCTYPMKTGCDGSASFVHDGEHLYVWDNVADGNSVVAEYWREDVGIGQRNLAWNHYGAGTRLDHNMNMAEGVGIRYRVCLGDYGTGKIWACGDLKVEYA